MFYHVTISLKRQRAKELAPHSVELDLTREDAISKIALPFLRKEEFYCGGLVVPPGTVEQIKFSRTQQASQDLVPGIAARWKLHGVVTFQSPESAVPGEGPDVTREILDEATSILRGDKPAMAKKAKSDRVFIVHGHDERAVDQTELLIRRFGLTPVILRHAPNKGNTVIEKFEAHVDVGMAIVLLTPDDFGGKQGGVSSPRARQNVIWEWGYLVAKLSRPNVICLYKEGVELPSDLGGLVTINIKEDVREKADEIRRELDAAGYDIK